mmetsp:Transcript_5875/g.16724  ORF Transcript_5875/g.16724 Transcript_5875/m.16724 type:complete len:120 (+) Transcript_5875:564-923(+)
MGHNNARWAAVGCRAVAVAASASTIDSNHGPFACHDRRSFGWERTVRSGSVRSVFFGIDNINNTKPNARKRVEVAPREEDHSNASCWRCDNQPSSDKTATAALRPRATDRCRDTDLRLK